MKKKPGTDFVQISPDAHGWVVETSAGVQAYKNLEEVAASLPARAPVRLALPVQIALLERLILPTVEKDELAGMVELQLEKTLPYGLEEVASAFELLSQSETESTVLSVAIHTQALAELCKPLRDRERSPHEITLLAQHVAHSCPPEETVLAVWAEQGQVILAVCEGGHLGWAQTVPGLEPEVLMSEMPSLLLGAELAGVPANYTRIRLAEDCPQLRAPLVEAFALPIEPLKLTSLPGVGTNLLPASWKTETQRVQRSENLKQRLMLVAVFYLLLLAAAFIYLAFTKRRVQLLDREVAALQPLIQLSEARRARWTALQPAVDPMRYTVEILHQAWLNLPSPEVRITTFEHTLAQFTITGEAPSANRVIEYTEKLRSAKELAAFQLQESPPVILPDNRAQFTIEGKL